MADVKISGLPASTTPLAGTEVLPIVQSGQTKQVSIANVTAGRAIAASTVQVTTTIGVGAATPSTSGSGITFPATQSASTNANTLDDYEEGTWEPVYTNWTTSPSTVYATYTKVGRLVTVNMYAFNGVATAFTASIDGLPFASAADAIGSFLANSSNNYAIAFTGSIIPSSSSLVSISGALGLTLTGNFYQLTATYQTT